LLLTKCGLLLLLLLLEGLLLGSCLLALSQCRRLLLLQLLAQLRFLLLSECSLLLGLLLP
jgi:hypothetical protein